MEKGSCHKASDDTLFLWNPNRFPLMSGGEKSLAITWRGIEGEARRTALISYYHCSLCVFSGSRHLWVMISHHMGRFREGQWHLYATLAPLQEHTTARPRELFMTPDFFSRSITCIYTLNRISPPFEISRNPGMTVFPSTVTLVPCSFKNMMH